DRIGRAWHSLTHYLSHWRLLRQQKEQLDLLRFLDQITTLTQSPDTTLEMIESAWTAASKHQRMHPEALLLYASFLNKHGQAEETENLLQEGLDKTWYDSWIHLYGLVQSREPNTSLKKAEKWLNKHPENAVLLLTLGRLSIQCQLWGKARSYFEHSIAVKPSTEAYAELGRLHEFLGEFSTGESCYKKGIFVAVGTDQVIYPTTVPIDPKPAQSFFNRLLGTKPK